jgi:hypothetical protein
MAEDKGAVPTNSNTYLKILQKLVEIWRRAIQADEVMNKTPVKEQAEEGPSKESGRDPNAPRRD